MSRLPRKNTKGFYHIVNRGVGLREVFLTTDDKLFFIELICNYAKEYNYYIHSYAILNNGYNLLIETKKDNLSLIFKVINAGYSKYFNKKYARRGYLWEGRFKSWKIEDKFLVLEVLRYIENLPVYVEITKSKEYSYYSSYRQFVGLDKCLECLENSLIFKKFNNISRIKSFLNKMIDIEYINNLHEQLKTFNSKEKDNFYKLPPLEKSNFLEVKKEDRNRIIADLYSQGYSQSAIGEIFNITQQRVHSIIKKMLNC